MSQSDLTSNHSDPEELDFTLTPCATCGKTSSENEKMVGCDGCKSWFHYRCVGVTEAVNKSKKWFCSTAACQEAAKKYQEKSKKSSKKTSSRSNPKPDQTQTQEEKLKYMEEEFKRQMEELEFDRIIKEKEMEFKLALQEKKLRMEQKLREKEMAQEKQLLERAREEKARHLEQMKAMRESYQKDMVRMEEQLNTPELPKRGPKAGSSGMPSKSKSRVRESTPVQVEEKDHSDEDDCDGYETDEEDDKESVNGKLDEPNGSSTGPNGLGQQRVGPTKMQLAARNGVTQKLPVFTGKPEDWPLFYGTFQASNEACGFTDVENLVRLQECLKGSALETVRGQLILPKSVPKVIDKLRRLYGRPELILQSLLEKVRNLQPPRASKLASFIPFGTAVEQLCEHLEAADLKYHLLNPLLIQDLVNKLPDSDKREWVRYKRKKKRVTLRTFTDFISEIVTDACEANVDVEYKDTSNPSKNCHSGKGALYNHSEVETENEVLSESDDETTSENSGCESEGVAGSVVEESRLKQCKVCKRTDHRLRYCQDFRHMSFVDRMKIVMRWNLCQICLNEHGGSQCKFKLRCNVGDCREPHNPLLHPHGVVGTSAHIRTDTNTFFRMIPVKLHYGNRSTTVLAFLDEGASVTLVEKAVADRLGAVGVPEKLTVKWTADITRVEKESQKINLWASSAGAEEKLLLKTVRTVGKLMLPQQMLDAKKIRRKHKHFRGLPISSYDGRPEMIIGLNNLNCFAPIESKIGGAKDPIAVRCKLGWTVYGAMQTRPCKTDNYIGVHQEVISGQERSKVKAEVFAVKGRRIRQANVRTAGGVYKRATVNLAVLEVGDGKSGVSGRPEAELRAGEC